MAPSSHSTLPPIAQSTTCGMSTGTSFPSMGYGDFSSAMARVSARQMRSTLPRGHMMKQRVFLAGCKPHPFPNLRPGSCLLRGSHFLAPLRTDEGSAPRETLNKSSWAVEYEHY